MNTKSFYIADYFSKFLSFAGPRVRRLLLIDILVGFFWFAVESIFVLILQGLLVSMGLITKSITILPKWYPDDLRYNVIILIGFGLLRCAALMLKNYCVVYSSQVFFYEKRSQILKGALNSNLNLSNNEIISTFSELIGNAGNHVVHGTNLVHYTIVTTLLALLSFKIAFYETLIGTLLLAISIYPLKRFSKKVNSYGRGMIESWNQTYSTLLNGLKNIFFLRLHEMTDYEIKKGISSLKDYENHYRSYAITSSFSLGLPQLIGIIVLGTSALAGKYYLNSSPTTLLSFFYLFVRLAQSASQMNNFSSHFKLTSTSFHRLINIMEQIEVKRFEDMQMEKVHSETLEIKIEDLVIGYNRSFPLSKAINVNLRIDTLFLVKGPSGSGKTTLLKTLLGDIKPLSGTVKYNNSNVNKIGNLSEFIGYVGPEPFLIYGTVKENLIYGLSNSSISDSEIWEVLSMVGMKESVNTFPNKLDEILLDETQMSSGQKQRLSFARALLRKPKFLILDEATANIDHNTESNIIHVISQLKKSMIIFVISHKNSFDFLANEVLEFKSDNK